MITPEHAADAINYLFAAQAITAVDNMDAVWADYINAELPDLIPADLLPAARACLKKWATEGRSWKVDLPRFADACRWIRKQKWEAFEQGKKDLYPDDPSLTVEQAQEWRKALVSAVHQGVTDEDTARRTAWQQIGRTPPQLGPTETHHIDYTQIGR